MAKRKALRSDMAWSTPSHVFVKGYDLCNELMGTVSLGDMAFLELTDRLPSKEESIVFNAMAITLVEHGLTPSAIATRLTLSGAPEAMQAAVGAGLAGLGSVFVGSMEGTARLLQQALPFEAEAADLAALATASVAKLAASNEAVPGLGHHFHKPVDPRAVKLFEIAAANGLSSRYVELVRLIAAEAQQRLGRPLPINVTGAIGALACELGMSWRFVRGIGVMARAIGLVGHVREELMNPLAREIKTRVEEEASAHLVRSENVSR